MAATAAGTNCSACGRALFGTVRFCPFCGRRQEVPVEPEPVPRVGPVVARAVDPPREPAVPARGPAPELPPQQPPPVAAASRSVPPRAGAGASVPPTAARMPPPVPPPAPPPVPPTMSPPVAGVLTGRWGRRPSIWKRQPVPVPVRMPARRRRRKGLLRLLVLLLLCWALWRWFAALPGAGIGTVTVVLPRDLAGTVLVDGEPHGRPGEAIRLPAGRHAIGLAAAGWDAGSREVVVEADRTVRVALEPRALPVAVAVSAVPAAAALSVDGHDAGGTPTTLSLPPGTHRLRVSAEGYAPESRVVRVRPGDPRTLFFSLRNTAPRRIALLAAVGTWSDPVVVASGERLGFVFAGRLRLRLGGQVLLLEPGGGVDLGEVDPGPLRVEAAQDTPFPVVVLVSREGDSSGGGAAADAER